LTVAVPVSCKTTLGMSIEYSFKTDDNQEVVPVGINVIDGSKRYGDEWLDQDIVVYDSHGLAVNINTVQELLLVEQLFGHQS
jgi:GTP:adenosylcobinamide-phosphate guanylyltransferase